jgi:outer membrane immunogenic protein
MHKVLLASGSLLALLVGPALAADVTVRAPSYRQVPRFLVYDWTGFYIGGHGGYAWTGKSWQTPAGVELVNYTADDWVYGVQGGYNYQIRQWVIGVEAQASFGRVRKGASWVDPGTDPWINPDIDPVKKPITQPRTGTTVEHLGTIAARLGYALDRSLIFVKGGAAWAHDVYRAIDTNAGERLLASATDTKWGWMVGVGYEYAFLGNWSAKIEYDYLGFGTQSITLVSVPGVTPPTRTFDVSQNISLVKAGINYRFGPMATPVVTK